MDTLLNMPLSEAIAIKIDWLIAEYDETRDIKHLIKINQLTKILEAYNNLETLIEEVNWNE